MFLPARLTFAFSVLGFCAVSITAQQTTPPSAKLAADFVYLDVVVTPKSGPPISGLQQQDFTVLDNKSPVPINSFQAVKGSQVPFEIIIVVDDVNTGVEHVAYERSEISKFLLINGGTLPQPTALAFLADSGLQLQETFTTDGNALKTTLDQHEIGLHSIIRSGGIYSAVERFNLSLSALRQLIKQEGPRPGRKIILWVSPGWPILSGPGVEEQLTSKQRDQIFSDVIIISTMMRQARVTLYSIDPLGTADFGGRSFRWEAFVKGVSKPSQVDPGDLALEVLAVQSGGLALNTGNDLSAYLQRCMDDTQAYYQLSIVPPLDEKPNTYHPLEVRVTKAGAVARTRTGYYSQP
jgi:VWFA-related protein